jgi:hypothetical protein
MCAQRDRGDLMERDKNGGGSVDTTPPLDLARPIEEDGGGRQEDRTPDLRVANAALSQLS